MSAIQENDDGRIRAERPTITCPTITCPNTVFMIVAHNNPALLARLVARLQAPWSQVVVLIDAKTDSQVFSRALASLNVLLLPDAQRVDVQWGGIGLTTAAVRMMRMARDHFPADRLCMLSGVDYPIKPIDEIGLSFGGDTEFVRIDRALDADRSGIHDDFVRYAYYNDIRVLNPRSSPVPVLQRAATKALHMVPRRHRPDLPLFHGCGWWCITRAAADWVLDYLDRRPAFFDWLRHANCPDEIFMQSLLKASPFASHIAQDATAPGGIAAEPNLHGCHYIDWSHANQSSPKALDIGDLPALSRSSAVFARKIDPVRSASLLDAVDRDLLTRSRHSTE